MTPARVKDDVAAAYADLRPLLFSIAYRMLGSVGEAGDFIHSNSAILTSVGATVVVSLLNAISGT